MSQSADGTAVSSVHYGALQACSDDGGGAAIIRAIIEKLDLGLAQCIRVVTAGPSRVAGSW